jgi:hypothetical protein
MENLEQKPANEQPEIPVTKPEETNAPAEKVAVDISADDSVDDGEPFDMLGLTEAEAEEANAEANAEAPAPVETRETAAPVTGEPPAPIASETKAAMPPEEKTAAPVLSGAAVDLDQIDPEAVAEDPEVITGISEEAKKQVAAKLGEEFDEFNPKHITLYSNVSQRLTRDVVKEVSFQKQSRLADREMKTLLPTIEAHQYAVEKFQNLPYREAMKIRAAEQNGDFKTVIDFFKTCREEFDGNKSTKDKADQKLQAIQTRNAAPKPSADSLADTAPEDDDDGLSIFGM